MNFAHSIFQGSIQGSFFHCLINAFPFLCAINWHFSVSLGVTMEFFSFPHSLTMIGPHQEISIPTHLITSSFYLSLSGNSEFLIISLLLWTVMRLQLLTGAHHPTLMSMQTEAHTWILSRGSIVQARWDVTIYKQASAGELEFAGWPLCIHFGIMIHTDSKQLSCVVILIYILAIASHIIKLYCFILPCPPLHLSKGFTCIELRVLKEKTNWSFSYCYFWSPPDLERKMKLLQSPGWSVCIQTFHGIPTVSSMLPQTQEVLYK